jgi:hypothetical protein
MRIMKIALCISIGSLLTWGCDMGGDDAAMFRGNLGRTGVYKANTVKALNAIRWKFKTEGGIGSSPAIADGVVFFGSIDKYLYAVDVKTGQEKWKFKTGSEVFSSPAIPISAWWRVRFRLGQYRDKSLHDRGHATRPHRPRHALPA